MSDARDWLSTLWPGSYKGVAFYFDKDESDGGRDVVVHEFSHRDDPYIEDMGEAARYYIGEIYVHGDDADATAAALEETFASIGPGILVVPARGPVSVHCQHFKRNDDKDKRGLIAFSVKFVRNGASTALVSVPLLGRLVLDAGDRLAGVLANLFPARLSLARAPDYAVAAASDGVQSAAAALDVTRQTWAVEPAASGVVRDAVAAIVDAAPVMIARSAPSGDEVDAFAAKVVSLVPEPAGEGPALVAQSLIATTRALAAGLSPISAQAAMAELADAFAPGIQAQPLAPSGALAQANALAADQVVRLAALIAWAEALALRSYASRPEGVAARAQAADRFEAELEQAPGAINADLFVAIEELSGRVIEYLSRLIADLAPVIEVETSATMPSLFWAWRLYADPLRAGEIVARNAVRHPSFMPLSFSALAPRSRV